MNSKSNTIKMTTKEKTNFNLNFEMLATNFKKLHMEQQEDQFYNKLSQQTIIVPSETKKQSTCSKEKSNYSINIPDDIYIEINGLLYWPMPKKRSSTKVTEKKEDIQRFNTKYTTEMFMLENQIFVLPERVTSMIKESFELSFISKKSQLRFCLLCNENISSNLQKFYEHIRCPKHVNCFKNIIKDQDNFALAKQFMEISNNFVKCYGCKQYIFNNKKAIQEHSQLTVHKHTLSQLHTQSDYQCNLLLKELENCWYNIQIYGCILCNKKFDFKIDFLQHINQEHRNEQDIMYDFCIPCTTLWVVYNEKDAYSYSIHCENITHKYLLNTLDFTVKKMPQDVKNLLNQVEKTVKNLLQLSEHILKDDLIQKNVLQSLKSSLSSQFPKLKIYPFGSRITGLGFPNSDIDIFVDCAGDAYERNDLSPSIHSDLDITTNLLNKDKDTWIIQEIIKKTRTPIIRLIHRLTRLQCDISFTNSLCVHNTTLIRSLNEACPSCRKLILFVKSWLTSCNLPGYSCITNYALTWLVIFYLQKMKFLPSIDTLIKQKDESRLISGWETGINCAIPAISIDISFIDLLTGFFEFYSDFNYKDHIVCPLIGDVVKKKDFINIYDLPEAMNPYIIYVETSNNPRMFRIDSSMCIQDPLDLSHNLTKAVQPLTLKTFKQYCKNSADIVRNISHQKGIKRKI